MSTMTIASHGQPSRKAPSGPLLTHFLQPIQSMGSTSMRPNGGWSGSSTQNMQSSTGQYSTQAGEPAQPVQHSVITANSFGFFLRAVVRPFERGSSLSSSGTIPGAFATSDPVAIAVDYIPRSVVCNGFIGHFDVTWRVISRPSGNLRVARIRLAAPALAFQSRFSTGEAP